MEKLGRILMVEDDPKDVELSMTALEDYNIANEVVVARDGEEALDYLFARGKFQGRAGDNPAVILLDLKLPKVDGRRQAQIDSGGRFDLFERRKRLGDQLQTRRECLCCEAGRFS
jgi:DNA-binding NtrC family response regulator